MTIKLIALTLTSTLALALAAGCSSGPTESEVAGGAALTRDDKDPAFQCMTTCLEDKPEPSAYWQCTLRECSKLDENAWLECDERCWQGSCGGNMEKACGTALEICVIACFAPKEPEKAAARGSDECEPYFSWCKPNWTWCRPSSC
jgi:hypothetical protein